MTLEILQEKMKQAMKEKDTLSLGVFRSAIDNIQKTAIAEKCRDNITEELVDKVLLKEKKTLQDQIDTCPKDRIETLEMYNEQMRILNHYVPQLLDEPEEIKEIIEQALAAAGIEPVKANKGAVMKTVMPILKGKADMKIVNQVISNLLV